MPRAAVVLVALAGCGHVRFDPLDDASTPTVTVRSVSLSGTKQPYAGAMIVVGDAAGALVSTATSTGEDVVAVVPGGMVTVVFPLGEPLCETFTGVQAGDVLEFGIAGVKQTALGTMSVDTGSQAPSLAATPCGPFNAAGGSPFPIARYASCPATTFQMLVNVAGAYAVVPVTFVDGGTVAVASFSATPEVAITASNIPSGTANITFNEAAHGGGFQVEGDSGTGVTMPGSSVTVMLPGEPAFGDFRSVDAATTRTGTANPTHHEIVRAPVAAPTVAVDLSADAMPWIANVDAEPETRSLSFSNDAAGPYTAASWSLYDQLPGRTPTAFDWYIVTPSGVSTVTMPELPAQFASLFPARGDELSVQLDLYDVDSWPDYNAVRRTSMLDLGVTSANAFDSVGTAQILLSEASAYLDPL